MTNRTPNEQDPARPGGSAETTPSEQGETAQPPEDLTGRMAGCCGPMMERMMGKCFGVATKKPGKQS